MKWSQNLNNVIRIWKTELLCIIDLIDHLHIFYSHSGSLTFSWVVKMVVPFWPALLGFDHIRKYMSSHKYPQGWQCNELIAQKWMRRNNKREVMKWSQNLNNVIRIWKTELLCIIDLIDHLHIFYSHSGSLTFSWVVKMVVPFWPALLGFDHIRIKITCRYAGASSIRIFHADIILLWSLLLLLMYSASTFPWHGPFSLTFTVLHNITVSMS